MNSADTASKTAEDANTKFAKALEQRFTRLQDEYLQGEPSAKATLAQLRRGLGKPVGSSPKAWELTVKAVPDELGGNPHWPSREEQAAYAAFTLYALHQQSLTTGAHERGVPFGKAVQRLRSTWSEAAVTRRFTAVSTAETIDEVLVHMRGLVSQFRAAQQSLDYVRLAFDLRDLLKPARAASVRLAWGRDFYRTEKDDDNNPAGGITNE